MRLGKEVKKRLNDQYSELRAGFAPPTLTVCLYDRLMTDVSGAYNLRTLDVKCLMLVSQFEGFTRWQIVCAAAFHSKSAYTVFARLERLGHIYSPSEIAGGKGKARAMYLTDSGKQIIHEVSRLWLGVCREAIKRKPDLEAKEPEKPKKVKKRVRQFEPFTLGA